MILVFIPDVAENLSCFFWGSRINHNFLKTTIERSVLLNVLTVLIQGCRTNALNFAPSKCRFEHVGCVKASGCTACSNNRMQFVNKENDIGAFFQLVHHRFHALLELTPILRSSYKGSKIKGNNAFVIENATNLSLDDAHRQPFGNSCFTNTWFTNQHRVVLLTPG